MFAFVFILLQSKGPELKTVIKLTKPHTYLVFQCFNDRLIVASIWKNTGKTHVTLLNDIIINSIIL